MATGKVKVNIEWLSDCGGCHVGIVDLHEKIIDVLGAIELQRCPVLTDEKGYPKADLGIVSGAIRNEHDRHAALAMRKSCDKIISFGTCAVYGGIPGAGMVHSRAEILDCVYGHNKTTVTTAAPSSVVSPLEKLVTPLDEVIDVDLYLPGCPPHATFIFDALIALVQGRTPVANDEAVCGRCRREMVKTAVPHIQKSYEGKPDEKQCLLSQGYVCLGSVTLDRCLAPCPRNGVACTGCAGPTRQILTEPNRDLRTEVAERMASLTAIPPEEIIATMERQSKSHYSYTMANKMIGQKPTFLIKKWIADVEEERT